ncbi:MAG: VOC family protein, partial [Erythrobacter sp.]
PYSLISHFADDEYVKPGKGSFMINLRVDDLDGFVAKLKGIGVDVLDMADEGYGKFAWILDPDGVKIELWEQVADQLP